RTRRALSTRRSSGARGTLPGAAPRAVALFAARLSLRRPGTLLAFLGLSLELRAPRRGPRGLSPRLRAARSSGLRRAAPLRSLAPGHRPQRRAQGVSTSRATLFG